MKESRWSEKPTRLQEAADKKDFKAFYAGSVKVFSPWENELFRVLSFNDQTLLTDKQYILSHLKGHLEILLNSTSVTVDNNNITSIL